MKKAIRNVWMKALARNVHDAMLNKKTLLMLEMPTAKQND